MPIDAAPPPAIVITKTERHDVRGEAIERVARQLVLAEGKDPDMDMRCGVPLIGTYTVTCNLNIYPEPLWYAYRDRAEKMLRDAFFDPSIEAR